MMMGGVVDLLRLLHRRGVLSPQSSAAKPQSSQLILY
jgi:hypothetical protein